MRKQLNWSAEEDQLILSNISLVGSKKWKNISQILKEKGFNKKQAECRERYINVLSLSLDKNSKISTQDLDLFYKKYQEYGPRWTQIQQFLPKKSQVELKNIFYGNIRCIVKKVFKFFTSKTAVFVNKFDTFTLQNIYSGKKNYKGLNFVKEDIKNMRYKFDEKICFALIEDKQEKYKKLFNILLDEELTKKSKHYHWFKKVSEKHFQTESNERQIEEETPTSLKNKNAKTVQAFFGSQPYPFLDQQQYKFPGPSDNQFQVINDKSHDQLYPLLNLTKNLHYQNHRSDYFTQAHQMHFQPYFHSHGLVNPYQYYENPYFFCQPRI